MDEDRSACAYEGLAALAGAGRRGLDQSDGQQAGGDQVEHDGEQAGQNRVHALIIAQLSGALKCKGLFTPGPDNGFTSRCFFQVIIIRP